MEGGFEAERGAARQGPGFEPPADPGAGHPSVHGLSLIAQIVRGRELAAEAAGVPPLGSDQVLDLQRSAGNQLTAGALARWTDLLGQALDGEAAAALARFATPGEALRRAPRDLLDHLLGARAADPAAHAAIAAALDALDPPVRARVSCTAGRPGPLTITLRGPAGAAAETRAQLTAGESAAVELAFAAAFGPAAAIAPECALAVILTAPGGGTTGVAVPIPFVAPRALTLAGARFAVLVEV